MKICNENRQFTTHITCLGWDSPSLKQLVILWYFLIEASREVANLTERKNPHTPVYGVKEFVRLSVCGQLWPNYLKTGWKNGLKKLGHLWQKCMSQIFLFFRTVAGRAWAEGRISNILTLYLNCLAWDRAEIFYF